MVLSEIFCKSLTITSNSDYVVRSLHLFLQALIPFGCDTAFLGSHISPP